MFYDKQKIIFLTSFSTQLHIPRQTFCSHFSVPQFPMWNGTAILKNNFDIKQPLARSALQTKKNPFQLREFSIFAMLFFVLMVSKAILKRIAFFILNKLLNSLKHL